MTIGQQFYSVILKHCGEIKNVRGVTENALKNMRDGKNSPSIPTLSKIFKANGIEAKVDLDFTYKGKKTQTTIKF